MNILPVLNNVPVLSAFVEIAIIGIIGYLQTYMIILAKSPGMLLERWGEYIKGKSWAKPLGGCMMCTSFWVTLLNYGAFLLGDPYATVAKLLAAAAVSVFIINKFN